MVKEGPVGYCRSIGDRYLWQDQYEQSRHTYAGVGSWFTKFVICELVQKR